MVKSVKARKRKIGRFRYNKDLKKKSQNQRKKRDASTTLASIKKVWQKGISSSNNYKNMGLVLNLNKAMKPENKVKNEDEIPSTQEKTRKLNKKRAKPLVAHHLELKAQENKKQNKIPLALESYLTYLLNTYGEDYKAMARDSRNFDQDTWKQIRRKIMTFKNCGQQYQKFLEEREQSQKRSQSVMINKGGKGGKKSKRFSKIVTKTEEMICTD